MENVINYVLIILVCVFWFFIIRKLISDKMSKVKTVKAEVSGKYKPESVSNYPGVSKEEKYVVIFQTKDEKLSFNVSEFSYNNYKIKDKGTLRYKGSKLISFK